jgi:hypothetical protein
MERTLLSIFLALVFSNSILGQETSNLEKEEKTNPIIYIEGFGGPAVVKNIGIAGGAELNYQTGKSLFTFRFINAVGYARVEGDYIIMRKHYKGEDFKEYALLYGRRWLSSNHSYSVSVGISCNNLEIATRDLEDNRFVSYENFYGVPFEANYKWFYSKKKPILLYYILIPSVGVKFYGNIGKYTFFGAGVTFGFGLNKKY